MSHNTNLALNKPDGFLKDYILYQILKSGPRIGPCGTLQLITGRCTLQPYRYTIPDIAMKTYSNNTLDNMKTTHK